MAIKINFGAWGGVFAVPSTLVDTHLKLATESQLKVLLYILRNNNEDVTAQVISDAVCVHISEVENALSFWAQRGFVSLGEDESHAAVALEPDKKSQQQDAKSQESQKVTVLSRLQRPDHSYVSNRLANDKELNDLLLDIEFVLKKFLSPADKATVVMIKDTLGLPCDVINMLVNYCVSTGKANMRAVEKMAASWSDKGIFTIEDAEMMIQRLDASNGAWHRVSQLFGIKNIGLPTQSQLSYADTWCNEWKFSDDMLLEAYTRCVDSKGEYNIRYINGILKKWYADKIFNLSDLASLDTKSKLKRDKKDRNASYDIETFESKSLFND